MIPLWDLNKSDESVVEIKRGMQINGIFVKCFIGP